MSVEEIDRRLEDRFALLRGGDRSAPDRHQALLTVIEWSWNLLGEAEQRALRWLALFHDGFTLEAAETVLGASAVGAVQGLVDQSLLAVREAPAGLRYRMLETVREFGRMRLASAGEDAAARAAQRAWAVGYVRAGQDATSSAPASSRPSTPWRPRRPTWPTSCAPRSPERRPGRAGATAGRARACSGRCAASTSGLLTLAEAVAEALAAGRRRRSWPTRPGPRWRSR